MDRGMLSNKPRTNTTTNHTYQGRKWDEENQEEFQKHIHPDMQEIRKNSKLQDLMKTEPHIYTWLTLDYTEKDIKKSNKKPQRQKITWK